MLQLKSLEQETNELKDLLVSILKLKAPRVRRTVCFALIKQAHHTLASRSLTCGRSHSVEEHWES